MADLVCDKCHQPPAPGLPAKVGGTHYVKHAGHRGRNSTYFNRVRTCGTWVEVKQCEKCQCVMVVNGPNEYRSDSAWHCLNCGNVVARASAEEPSHGR